MWILIRMLIGCGFWIRMCGLHNIMDSNTDVHMHYGEEMRLDVDNCFEYGLRCGFGCRYGPGIKCLGFCYFTYFRMIRTRWATELM